MSSEQLRMFRSELSSASRAFKAAAVDQMRAMGVHPGQNFLLEELRAQEPLTTGEIARRMHVEVPTVVRMTQRMQAAGLLERQRDANDRRRVLISLTAEGKRAARAMPRLLDTVSEQALSDLSDNERQTLIKLLHRVISNLDWPPVPTDKRSRP
jgi:DNA-binding MarR family transcriptional regulator